MGFNGIIVLIALFTALASGTVGGYFDGINSMWKVPFYAYTLLATLFAFVHMIRNWGNP